MHTFLKNKKALIFISIILINAILFIAVFLYFYLNYKEQRITNRDWSILVYNENKKDAFSIIYNHVSKNIFIYRIKPDIFIMENNVYKPLFPSFTISEISDFLSRYLDIETDFYAKINDEDSLKLLDVLGGVDFFNTNSSFFEKGPVIINSKNINAYIEKIEDPQLQYDESVNVAINYFLESFRFFNKIASFQFSKILYDHISTDASKYTFTHIVNLIQENNDSISISYNHINYGDEINNGKKINVILMSNRSIYDAQKVKDFYQTKESSNNSSLVEVINTTEEKRLAARTTGFLKTKKITVSEFSNSKINLSFSTILFHKFNANKRNYLKKITNIDSDYYLFNYHNDYDATILLAEKLKK